jgi:Helix-turn-helix domain
MYCLPLGQSVGSWSARWRPRRARGLTVAAAVASAVTLESQQERRDISDLTGKITYERIKHFHNRVGMSRPVLGGLVGRSAEWVKAVETGRLQVPRLPMLLKIARALDVRDLAELTGNGHAVPCKLSLAKHIRHGEAWSYWEQANEMADRLGLRYRHIQASFSTAVMNAHAVTLDVELRRPGVACRRTNRAGNIRFNGDARDMLISLAAAPPGGLRDGVHALWRRVGVQL